MRNIFTWKRFITSIIATMAILSSYVVYADYTSDVLVLKQKAMEYAGNPAYAQDGPVNMATVNANARALADVAMALGQKYSLSKSSKTPTECNNAVNELNVSIVTFLAKAHAHLYKTIALVNGNIVMLIAGTAGQIVYAALHDGNFCNKTGPTDVDGAYWSAYIMNGALLAIDMAFS